MIYPEPKKILVAGDSHGNASFIQFLAKMAEMLGATVILQVGDFGYWTHTMSGVRYMNDVEQILKDYNLTLVFLDGNHENFDLLWRWEDHTQTHDGFWMVWGSHRLLYSPRGHRFTWSGKTLLTLGGAPSIDKDMRLGEEDRAMRTLWWPQELITESDLYACGDEPVDYMFTHDVPHGINIPGIRWFSPSAWPEAYLNRKAVEEMVLKLRPSKLYHGHYHIKYNDAYKIDGLRCQIVGLAHDGRMKQAYSILEL